MKNETLEENKVSLQQFAEEVRKGLSAHPKYLPSRYFYDAVGDALFQQIMNMPEYYLTRSEFHVLSGQKEAIARAWAHSSFDLIELGAGDGYKTKVLLRHFLDKQMDFRYLPIDISANVLQILEQSLQEELPELRMLTIEDEYFQALSHLSNYSERPKLILFMGSNIGNFTPEEATDFMGQLSASMRQGDGLLIGFDLKKSPHQILAAYNDAGGITRNFNLNLLKRINRELGGDFALDQFEHFPIYDPELGAAKSYLVSKQEQEVYIEALDEAFAFERAESIYTEISQKFSLQDIKTMAERHGFEVKGQFFDEQRWFVDSLWIKK
ncbi:L-histidine N(alpha)-methyltransferase [Cytophagales bacterium LB-30]|uniref:L-histidine N(Alpha)-methyltransferase n=1 Tax=Shiella aurantiaca TaxID=3058365 RepID=A0ABT8F7I9_9BACT|nr:L-histidine N(alpha)-methyltransferase [Shiella aurantiaca]MDN4166435.1 L-histidine N(alpha)-methyltransferase [Shiella aurantiaca]